MRLAALLFVFACTKGNPQAAEGSAKPPAPAVAPAAADAAPAPVKVQTYADLPTALAAIIPVDARVVGFGEIHARTDRAQVKSALARFTADALPVLGPKLSDLIIETWIVDKGCGKQATEATAKVATTMRRPLTTGNEIGDLADAARKLTIQPHAMRVTCADYERISPPGMEVDAAAMLTLTTSELTRIATEAIAHRDKEPNHRPWIALYGGALHNDRFPDKAVAEWSYAAKVDAAASSHFVEVDLVVPELAEADPNLAKQPWFPVVTQAADKLQVWQRGERSYVVVFPRTPK